MRARDVSSIEARYGERQRYQPTWPAPPSAISASRRRGSGILEHPRARGRATGRAQRVGRGVVGLAMEILFKIGDAPKRREDLRFVTGSGRYLDDLAFDGLAHAVVLRSPHAHALIRGIDTGAARAAPGVLVVLTAVEAAA